MKDQFIKERIEELNNFIGEPPSMVEWLKDDTCFVCGQPFNKSPQYKELKELLFKSISSAYSAGEMAMLEKVEGIVPELREPQEGWPTDPFINIRDGGFNSCRSTILTELKKLKEGI